MVVTVPNAGVDENAVMICPGDTALAYIAVLRTWGLDESTGSAFVSRVKESVIIGIERHVVSMILTGDVTWICGASEIKQYVRHDDRDENSRLGEETDLGPDLREIQVLGYGHDQ